MKNGLTGAFRKRFCITLAARFALALVVSAAAFTAAVWRGAEYAPAAAVAVGAFIVVAIITKLPSLLAPGWDGTVTSRTVRYTTIRDKMNVPEYAMTITSDAGREYSDRFLDINDNNIPCRIEYYNDGERIRKHRGYKYFEKYDKSGRNNVICINCGEFSSKDKEICIKCGLPLLKDDITSDL